MSIARAVLAQPKILILDEATSSVDTRTERTSGRHGSFNERPPEIIAHRLSTIRDADRLWLWIKDTLSKSAVTTLAKQGIYYRLYQQQFAGNVI